MNKKKAWFTAITRVFLTIGIFVVLTTNAYSKTKKNVIYPISLSKQEEQLRKLAYKYRNDIPKKLLKKAKEDKAILHSSWIQGENFASDLYGNHLPIPDTFFPVSSFNDTVFIVLDTSLPTNNPYRYTVFATNSAHAYGVAMEPYHFKPALSYYNSVTCTERVEDKQYMNFMCFLGNPKVYAVFKSEKEMFAYQMVDSCKKDTVNKPHMEFAKMQTAFWNKKKDPLKYDESQYKNNIWLQKARAFQNSGEYKKALDCYDIFTTFEIKGMEDPYGLFAYDIKYNKLYCLRQLKKYNAVLNAMDVTQCQDSYAKGLYYNRQTKRMVNLYAGSEVESTYKDKILALCKECQQLQEERERNSALLLGAIFGAVANTASNIAGGGTSNSQSVSSGYTGGSSSSSASASSSATKTAQKCSACGGTGRCNACRNHIGRATASSKDKTPCKGCGGNGKCYICGGSGYKK